MVIASLGIIALKYEKQGGLKRYREALWDRLAFAARYGNQSLPVLLQSRAADLDEFNRAINQLIQEENKTGR